MVHWLVQTLRDHPEIAVFLTLAFGFFIGKVNALQLQGTLCQGIARYNNDSVFNNEAAQGPEAYHQTHYASLNLMWQPFKLLTVGVWKGFTAGKRCTAAPPGPTGAFKWVSCIPCSK